MEAPPELSWLEDAEITAKNVVEKPKALPEDGAVETTSEHITEGRKVANSSVDVHSSVAHEVRGVGKNPTL